MKHLITFGTFLFLNSLCSPATTETNSEKVTTKHTIDYYTLLPLALEKNPDLIFTVGRNPKNMSLDEKFLSMIASAFQATTFVETGTYLGDTTEIASRYFKTIHSIELSEDLCKKAQKRFENAKNITVYQGDSCTILAAITKKLQGKTVFFLDAHYSMGETARGTSNTPIISELEVIKKSSIKDAILLIDDIRMFYSPLVNVSKTFMYGYPTLTQIIQKALEINSDYKCAVIFDTLILYPAQEDVTVSPFIRSITMSRLYDSQNNYDIEDIIKAEHGIALVKDNEQQALAQLTQCYTEEWSKAAGLSRHHPLWFGLILLANEQYEKAIINFKEAKNRGICHWRIDWYLAMAEAQCFFAIK